MRLLVLCTHNSARSQMAEGWLRQHAAEQGLNVEVFSAGTEKTRVKPEAVEVMGEVGIDLLGHTSKTLDELPDPWNFDLVITVCDTANEACPTYPAKTQRYHVSFEDPTGQPLGKWRQVRDQLKVLSREIVAALKRRELPDEAVLTQSVYA